MQLGNWYLFKLIINIFPMCVLCIIYKFYHKAVVSVLSMLH